MRVICAQPRPNFNWTFSPLTSYFGFFFPSPGLQTVATAAHRAGHEVRIADTWGMDLDGRDLQRLFREFQPQVVAACAKICEVYEALSFLALAKQLDPDVITVLGGQHVTLTPEECLRVCPELDYTVVGEGERTFVELLRAIEDGEPRQRTAGIDGLGYLDGETFVRTRPRRPTNDPDEFHPVQWDLFPIGTRRYKHPILGPPSMRGPAWTVEFGRGCTFNCRFCGEPYTWRHHMAFRDPVKVVDDIEHVFTEYGIKMLLMSCTDMLYDLDRLEVFILEMEKRRLVERGFGGFLSLVRTDSIVKAEKLIAPLVKVGWRFAIVGTESNDDDALEYVNKQNTVDTNVRAQEILHDANLALILLLHLVGLPIHTRESLLRMRERTRLYGPRAFTATPQYTPFPGSPLYFEVARKGLIESFDYELYETGKQGVCRSETLSAKEIDKLTTPMVMGRVFNPRFIAGQFRTRIRIGFWIGLLGFGVAFSEITKAWLGPLRRLWRRLRTWIGRPDPLWPHQDRIREVNMEYARAKADELREKDDPELEQPMLLRERFPR